MKKHTKDKLQHSQVKHKQHSQLLDLYIRNNKKQALLVHVNRNTQLEHLTRAIQARFQIPADNQVLFHNGRALDSQNTHKLQDKAIVHVVDSRNITPSITINVRRLNIPSPQQFTISSSQLIQDFIVRNIRDEEPDKMFFVYTGRHLNRRRSFAQEYVESQSQLFCLHQDRDQVKGERRQMYQKVIKEEAAKNQKPVSQAEQKQQFSPNNSGLQSYLPKGKTPEQSEGQQANNQGNPVQEVAPNFKKKNITKEINLASNEPSIRHAPHSEENLSLMVQNNCIEHKSHTHSAFFNQGSSISEIVPQEGQNPQSNKKSEEGSMFQSAFMGFNNESSFVNQNQRENKVNSANPPQQQDLSQNSQRSSFNFDNRAPQLINLPPDRHLTLIERQILEVTQSEEISRENVKDSVEKLEEEESLQKRECEKERDQSIYNCQFQLGQIQNHQLSVSAELRVTFNQKEPLSKQKKSNEILIQDEENNNSFSRCEKRPKAQLLTINQDLRQQKSNSQLLQEQNHSGHHSEQISSNPQQQTVKKQLQKQIKESGRKAEEDVYVQIDCCATPKFVEFPQHNFDAFFIQQQPRSSLEDELQAQQQKFQCQTNGPSSSSNFHSKKSSRIRHSQSHPNQYEFGDYHRPFVSVSRRSGYNDAKPSFIQDAMFQKSRSQISKIDAFEKQGRMRQEFVQSNKQDSQLQIVQLSIDFRIKKKPSFLLDQYNDVQQLRLSDNEVEREVDPRISFPRKDSKIEELNNLISDILQPKRKESDNLLINTSEIRRELQDHNHLIFTTDNIHQAREDSDIQIETSLNQEKCQSLLSQQSLQRVEIRKTHNSYQSQNNFLQHQLKYGQRKQNFSSGQLIFRSKPNYFQPLQFYVSLFEKELGFRCESTR